MKVEFRMTWNEKFASCAIALLIITVALFSSSFNASQISHHPDTHITNNGQFYRPQQLVQIAPSSSTLNTSLTQGGITIFPAGNASPGWNQVIYITLSLSSSGSLSRELTNLSNPANPVYGTKLSPSQISGIYGISPTSYQHIASYFSSFGLKVFSDSTRISLTVGGNVSEIDSAFHTKIGTFEMAYDSDGVWQPIFGPSSGIPGNISEIRFYASVEPSYLPYGISGLVSGVAGLSGFYLQPSVSLPGNFYPGKNLNTSQLSVPPGATFASQSSSLYYLNGTYGYLNSSESSSLGFGNSNYQLLFPGSMPAITGASNLWSGKSAFEHLPDLGQNVTVALIEVGLLNATVVSNFSSIVFHNPNQILNRLTQIPLLGATVSSGLNYSWTIETALDLEYLATMAPEAHIDLIGIPSPSLSLFDYAYSYIAQNLVTFANATTSVSITSNSYGGSEYSTVSLGSPMYLTVENSLLEELALEGVTNFFASGDYGSDGTAAGADIPAIANGSISVGGGQLTASSGGVAFPDTGVYTGFNVGGRNLTLEMANATGMSSFSYWYYPSFGGFIGGGFGQSMSSPQPWWQNALDTYSSGARLDPVIAGAAAFNMTVYLNGWEMFYGGTSFATPITAGEWALIEEQVNLTKGIAGLGDINPLLFDIHSTYQAMNNPSAPKPYIAMDTRSADFDTYYANSESWLLYNYSINLPSDPLLPEWFASLGNPAGTGWNFLQGLGMINMTAITSYLTGYGMPSGVGLIREPLMIEVSNASGGYVPFNSLSGGVSYHFVVHSAYRLSGNITVRAYSGGSNSGVYGGGQISYITLNSSNLSFSYMPEYAVATSAEPPEFASFYISAGSNWSFQFYSVVPKPASGTLVIGASDVYGSFETGQVNVPMFTLAQPGQYMSMYPAVVTLNGQPVDGAIVKETAVAVNYSQMDPYLNQSSYQAGSIIGTFITDLRGSADFWTNAMISTNGGPLPTQVFLLQAEYQGMLSNVLTAFVEPQAGSYFVSAHVDIRTGVLEGNITFNDMKYVSNISIGLQGTDHYYNQSFLQDTQVYGGIKESNVSNGVIPFSFNVAGTSSETVNLTVLATGANVEEETAFSAGSFRVVVSSSQDPIQWFFSSKILNGAAIQPVTKLTTASSSNASGNVLLSYRTSDAPAGSSAEITANTSSASMVLAVGLPLNGSFAWNTTELPDGNYTVSFVVVTPSGVRSSSSLNFYLDNNQLRIETELELISKIESGITNTENKLTGIRAEIKAGNTTQVLVKEQTGSVAAEISNLSGMVSSLAGMVGSGNRTVYNLNSQIAYLRAQLSSLNAQTSSNQTSAAIRYIMQPLTIAVIASLSAICASAGFIYGRRRKK